MIEKIASNPLSLATTPVLGQPPSNGLPAPTVAEIKRCQNLTTQLAAEISEAGGVIPFSRFMEKALYTPELGYYTSSAQVFGSSGHFVTAPGLGKLFAYCIAHQAADILQPGEVILEVGAGDGSLAINVLLALNELGCLPSRYLIVERSAALCQLQQDHCREQIPQWLERLEWLSEPPSGICGLILANELLDALPAERVQRTGNGFIRAAVRYTEENLVWTALEIAEDDELADWCRTKLQPRTLPEGYVTEAGLSANTWISDMAKRLQRGVMLLIDYGYDADNYYHPQRDHGTLACYYRHRVHDDPLMWPGLQDISVHVEFSSLVDTAATAGLDCLGYSTQAGFLLGAGILDRLQQLQGQGTARYLTLSNEVKRLTLGSEMGELVKVLALGRDHHKPLSALLLADQRNRL